MILSIARPWIITIGIAVVSSMTAGSFWIGYNAGQNKITVLQLEQTEKLRAKSMSLADELEHMQAKQDAEDAHTIREIYSSDDACADVDVPDSVLEVLGYSED